MYPNKYEGRCNNPACNRKVAVGDGFIQKINDRWVTWCQDCIPARKAKPTSLADERRILTSEGRIYTPYEPKNLPLVKAMPGARFVGKDNGGPYWTVSTKDADRARVLELADRLGLDVAPAFRTVIVTENAKRAETSGLYPFQVDGVNWLSKQDHAVLGDEMGLGKTPQALVSLPDDLGGIVVCPAGLKYNWRDEASVWKPSFKVSVLEGRESFRFPEPRELVITNFDILPKWLLPPARGSSAWHKYKPVLDNFRLALREKYPQLKEATLIVDEIHKCKNYKAKRAQQVKELGNLCRAVWGLTGTALENDPSDLYGVFETCGLAWKAFGSWDRFLKLYNASYDDYGGIMWGQPDPILPEYLGRCMLRRERAVVLPDLPKKTYKHLVVGQSASILKEMDALWEEHGGTLEVAEILPPFEEFSSLRSKIAKDRIPAMLEYVENCEEQNVPLVVFSAHLAPIDALLTRPGWACITGDTKPELRQEIVRKFQAGLLKGVGLTIKAGGVGLTLTRAWKALFVDLEWNPSINSQAEDRICRIGQMSNVVEIIRMVSDHVLDRHILKILAEKIRLIEATFNSVVKGEKYPNKKPVSTEGDETVEEFEARMKRIEEAAAEIERSKQQVAAEKQKEIGKSKVEVIFNREKARNTRPLLPLTEPRIAVVKESFKFMMSVCDGAVSRDDQGFNKPDASVARFLVWAGLENEQELNAAYYMLARYHRQLHKSYPLLFQDA